MTLGSKTLDAFLISRKSPYRPIWDAFLAGRFELYLSEEILNEYQEILEQQNGTKKPSKERERMIMDEIANIASELQSICA